MNHTVEKIELPNGVVGLLIDVPEAKVTSFDFNFRAGDYLSPDGKWDTAHIMEHMVLGANKRYHKQSSFFREFSKNGAYCNASTGTYHLSYEAECAEFETNHILDMLCLAIEAPRFSETVFLSEKSNIKEELRGLSNNHFARLSLDLSRAMGLCELNYASREKQLKNITLQDIKNHYKNTHIATNLRFIIAGQVKNHQEYIMKRIDNIDIPTGQGRIALEDESVIKPSIPITIKNDSVNNIYYRWETAFDGILSEKEDYASSALLGTLLGTLHSRIFGVARERGLVYGISYGKYRTKNNHFWWVGGQALPENIEAIFKLIAKELRAVADGQFTQREMQEARQYSLGNFLRSVQTVGQLLGGYYSRFAYDDEIEAYDKVQELITGVTRQRVIKAAQKCLDKDNPWGLGFYGAVHKINSLELKTVLSNSYLN